MINYILTFIGGFLLGGYVTAQLIRYLGKSLLKYPDGKLAKFIDYIDYLEEKWHCQYFH